MAVRTLSPDEEGITLSTTHSILCDRVESALGAGTSPVSRGKGGRGR